MVANAIPTTDPVEIARNREAQHKYVCWRAEKVSRPLDVRSTELDVFLTNLPIRLQSFRIQDTY